VSAPQPGTAVIVASCTPPQCNSGVNATIYSNPVTVTVTGTAATARVLVTSTGWDSTSTTQQPVIIPIPTDTNTPGTAINIPKVGTVMTIPNSMLMTGQGDRAYLGSSNGVVAVDTVAGTILGTVTNTPGKVISISPNGNKIIVSDVPNGHVFVLDKSLSGFEIFNIAGATAAAWTPDSLKAYIVAGSTMYQYATQFTSLRTIPMSASAPDITMLSQFSYQAGGEASAVTARSTCRTPASTPSDTTWAPEDTVGTGTTPDLITALPTGTSVVAVEAAGTVDKVTPTSVAAPPAGSDCPPSVTNALATANWGGFGIGAITPRELIPTADGTRVYVTSNQTVLLGYNPSTNATFTVPVNGAAQFTGGSTLSGAKVYVGANDQAVHVIDTATNLQATRIPIAFGTGTAACATCQPDLVVVQQK
jgi:hypothetical protein